MKHGIVLALLVGMWGLLLTVPLAAQSTPGPVPPATPPAPGTLPPGTVAPPASAPTPPGTVPPAPPVAPVPPPPVVAPEAPAAPAPPPDPFTMELPVFGQGLFRRALTEALPVQAGPVPPTYVLGPGDLLQVRLWAGSIQQVEAQVPVDTEGAIVLGDIGRLVVQGMTQEALRGLLQQRYERLYKDFVLEVTVAQMRTVEVFVIGEVHQPGKFLLPGNATVFTALYAAGGPNDTGSLRNLRLTRADQSLQTIDLYDYLLEGKRVADVPLLPGDTVFVPLAGARVGVAGLVKRPAQYELKGQQTLDQVLAMAGGLQPQAYALRVQVRRYTGFQSYRTIDVDLAKAGVAEGFVLQDGDRVVAEEVTDELANAVYLEGQVYRPGTYELREGLTLAALLRAAQGLTPEAYGEWALLRRVNPETARYENVAINPLGALQGKVQYDLALQARDRIFIYNREAVLGESRVSVLGHVREPGKIDFLPGMTVRDAVLKAGGLLPEAYTARAQLLRVLPDMRKEALAVNLQLAMAGDPQANLLLQPYDQLTVASVEEVGAAAQVTIEGAVKQAGGYPRYEGMKVSDLLLAAGGVLPGASGVIQVTHGRYSTTPEVERVQFAPGAALPVVTPDLLLRDDDHVAVMGQGGFVEKPWSVTVAGAVNNPGPYVLLHPTAQPEGVWQVLKRAGGLRAEAYGPGIVVYRRAENLMTPEAGAGYLHVAEAIDRQRRELKLETGVSTTTTAPAASPAVGAGPATSAAAGAPAGTTTVPAPGAPGSPGAGGLGGGTTTGPAAPTTGGAAGTATTSVAPVTPTAAAASATPGEEAAAVSATGPAPATTTTQQVAQGLAEVFSTQNAVTLVIPPRELRGTTFAQAIPVDWAQMQASQGARGDVILQDGDVVYVPPQPSVVLVAGAVQNQAPIRYQKGMTVQEAIRQAGGASKDAALKQVLAIRLNGQVTPVGMREHVQPGDIVVVPTEYIVKTVRAQTPLERVLSTIADIIVAFRVFK